MCQTCTTYVRSHYAQFSGKNEVSILNGWVTAKYSVYGRHFVRHLWICNPICVKLLQLMCDVIPHNSKKNDVSISNRFSEVHKHGIHTHTHTQKHTHTHKHTHTRTDTHTTIALGEMQYVAFRLKIYERFLSKFSRYQHLNFVP